VCVCVGGGGCWECVCGWVMWGNVGQRGTLSVNMWGSLRTMGTLA
jgi:hypothetical protein